MTRTHPGVLLALLGAASLQGCGDGAGEVARLSAMEPPRGVVLVSIDTLRADHLGTYGYGRDTSPRLDALAAASVVFEVAVSQAPSTLTSHLALFTSLLPSQFFPTADGPVPPDGHVLAQELATFPQLFRAAGFRTAGHSEGGYVSGFYGFDRGFEQWSDPQYTESTDIEVTVAKGIDFLRQVAASDERFLLFLHTYSVHDPYEPPAPFRGRFTAAEPPTEDRAAAATLAAVNAGQRVTSDDEVRYFEGRYDEGIRYADDVLGRLWDALAELGLDDEAAVVVTSDHGEEFFEHGRYLHTQLYPEHLRVPLIVRVPGVAPRRVQVLVRNIDIAPTILELAGVEPLPRATGRSLVPLLLGGVGSKPEDAPPICAETWDGKTRLSMLATAPERAGSRDLLWIVRSRPSVDPEGAWVSGSLDFDVPYGAAGETLRLLAFHESRAVRVVLVDQDGLDGDVVLTTEVPPSWIEVPLPADTEGRRLRIEVAGCVSPRDAGVGDDPRCLGVQMARPVLEQRSYLDGFPASRLTEIRPAPGLGRLLAAGLDFCSPPLLVKPVVAEPDQAALDALRELGYVQ